MNSKIMNQVIALAEEMFKDSPFANIQEGHTIADTLYACRAGGSLFVEIEDEKVVGFLAALLLNNHPIIGKCKLAAELAWYVHKDWRGRGIADRLINGYEKWAALNGCTHSMTSAMFNEHYDQVAKSYEKRGYQKVEASFIKELK